MYIARLVSQPDTIIDLALLTTIFLQGQEDDSLIVSGSEANDVEGHADFDPEIDDGPRVIDETYAQARTMEEFLHHWRLDEQVRKDAALARRLQEEEV